MSLVKKSIAIDMDGVIADTVVQFIRWHQRDSGVLLTKKDFDWKKEADVLPDGRLRKYVTSKDFFRDVPVMEGAVEAVQSLMKNYEVYIVSAAMEFPFSLPEKKAWLEDHFPFISWTHIIFCGDKSVIGTDYMIDDHLRNLDSFRGKALMFTAGHNLHANTHTRINSWADGLTFFREELKKGQSL